jgi:hypothetical protein
MKELGSSDIIGDIQKDLHLLGNLADVANHI